MEILTIKEQCARWDFQRLLDSYVERDVEWLFSQEGVANRPESTNFIVTICDVCAKEDLKAGDTIMMDCVHTFYNVCWTKHFLTQMDIESRSSAWLPILMSSMTKTS